MSESTGRKIGPRERLWQDEHGPFKGEPDDLKVARLADTLGEALYEWKELLDAYVENRPPPDERPEIAIHDAKIIVRLRAVLEEVDRG